MFIDTLLLLLIPKVTLQEVFCLVSDIPLDDGRTSANQRLDHAAKKFPFGR